MNAGASISHLIELAEERFRSFELFSPSDYLALHPDVAAAGVDAYWHALRFGANEGRPLISPFAVIKKLSTVAPAVMSEQQADVSAAPTIAALDVLVSSRGNAFMNEIAHMLADDVRSLGVQARVRHETDAMEDVDPARCIVVAPHEFFTQGSGRHWMHEEFVRQCVVFNVEQAQTPWFAAGLIPALLARGVIDLCPQMVTVWRNMGASAIHYEPGVVATSEAPLLDADAEHPLVEALPPAAREYRRHAFRDRPVDLCFFGTRSARRDSLFARYAGRFAPCETFIYFRQRLPGPIRANSSEGALTRIADHVAAVSKLCLNIHRDDVPYFEWHRMVKHGIASGGVVVSDTCLPHPHYKENEHFLQSEARHLPNLVDWVLKSPDGQAAAERIVANNMALLSDSSRRTAHARALLRFMQASNVEELVDA